jgi:hypothetical protein
MGHNEMSKAALSPTCASCFHSVGVLITSAQGPQDPWEVQKGENI